jgi:hypothetical protein
LSSINLSQPNAEPYKKLSKPALRSADDPMPPALNNKFDALPPAEGLVFDFVFDFKARGQWKHWNDIVKNSEIPEKLSPNALIPTVDTARCLSYQKLQIFVTCTFYIFCYFKFGRTSFFNHFEPIF